MEALKDRVAIVTGASRGIGLAIAQALASQGCNLILTGRDEKALAKVSRELALTKIKTLAHSCDVRDPQSIDALFRAVRQKFNRLDILINNAGIAHPNFTVAKLPAELWKDVIDTNLTGMFLITQAALPMMQSGGTIVNNLSIVANPGATDTEIWNTFWPQAPRKKMMSAATIAEAVVHAIQLPQNATVETLEILPTIGLL